MKKLLAVLAFAGMAGVANAEIVDNGVITIDLAGNVINQGPSPAVDVTVYDNWTNPGSNLQALYKVGGDEIADLLVMTGGGLLGSCGINVGNSAATGSGLVLTGGVGVVRFYDGGTGNYINGFSFNLPALNLAVGGSSRISFADGALAGLNINLPNTVYMSLQYTSVLGTVALSDVSHQIRNPVIVGSSADGIINITSNQNINFGGNPVANSGYFVKLVPAPSSVALLGLGGLMAARRRR
jgi:hypothetical protein